MKRWKINRRVVLATAMTAFLAGCQIVPKTTAPEQPDPVSTPTPEPSATALPSGDDDRHRVALLVPLSGGNGQVGQAIANATTMALLDTNASNLRITTYDTATDAGSAAARALADGNKLILGPLMGDNVPTVRSAASRADVPVISFSNDTSVAGNGAWIMGNIPAQSIRRSVGYARSRGASSFAALVPEGQYGRAAVAAFTGAVEASGGRVSGTETYARGNTSIVSAAERLRTRGAPDAILIADGARLTERAAGVFRPRGSGTTQILGTELLSGESSVTRSAAMRGAVFSAVSDGRFKRFSDSYEARFSSKPYRIATLGYDAVLLALRVAQDWRVGTTFPTRKLRDDGGFLGLDGAFRFNSAGVIERAMEVREVRDGRVVIVENAPSRFND